MEESHRSLDNSMSKQGSRHNDQSYINKAINVKKSWNKRFEPKNHRQREKMYNKSFDEIIPVQIPINREISDMTDIQVNPDSIYSFVGIQNSTPMTKQQMQLVYNCLIESISRLPQNDVRPKFTNFTHQAGRIVVTCVDQVSRDWLVNEVVQLRPWPNAELSTVLENEPYQATLYLPNRKTSSIKQALKLLRIQNQGLNTDLWIILRRKNKSNGVVLTFALDESSAEALKSTNGRVTLGFKTVSFRMNAKRIRIAQSCTDQASSVAEKSLNASVLDSKSGRDMELAIERSLIYQDESDGESYRPGLGFQKQLSSHTSEGAGPGLLPQPVLWFSDNNGGAYSLGPLGMMRPSIQCDHLSIHT